MHARVPLGGACASRASIDAAQAAAIKRYKGDFARLSEADRFFAEVRSRRSCTASCAHASAQVVHVTLFAERVELMLFRAEFRETVTHCRRQMSIINMAAVQTKSSHRFTRLLEVILQLGNMLNERGNAGVAQGFRLDSLLKMADTRASNSNMTLLHYLVRLLDAKMPELNDFFNDMPNVEPASKRTCTSRARAHAHAVALTGSGGVTRRDAQCLSAWSSRRCSR